MDSFDYDFRLNSGDFVYDGWDRSKVHVLVEEVKPDVWKTRLVSPPVLAGKPAKISLVGNEQKVTDLEEIEMYKSVLIESLEWLEPERNKRMKQVTPSTVSSELRRIASKIDASENPSITLFIHDLNNVIASIREANVPGMEWLDYNEVLKVSEQFVDALKRKSAGDLEELIPQMYDVLKKTEFKAKSERQKKQYYPGFT